ncbi:MAG: flippase-like domain-containing protein [Deltaproteobacteria bacterium]|nr:flippase-like domain-containing protein [Deltaproteobacteria bacterium]
MSDPAPPEDKKKRSWSAIFNLVMLVVGACALAWMLRSTSWHELRNVITGVGVLAAVILALELGGMCCDAAALKAFMAPEARMVTYVRVLGSWASGRAINVLTPFSALGEATKVTMLSEYAPRARVLSSMILLSVARLYLEVLFMVVGIPITLLLVDLPDAIKVIVFAGMAVIIPAMIALGFMIQRGAVASLVGILRRVRLIGAERAANWKEKLKETDQHIRELHKQRTSGTRLGMLFVLISKALTVSSTILIMVGIGVELSPALVIGVLSVGVLITWVSSTVPLGMGLADGGNYALYTLLGASGDHGMYFAMIARARSLVIAIVGLAAMSVIHAQGRYASWQIGRKIIRLKAERAAEG